MTTNRVQTKQKYSYVFFVEEAKYLNFFPPPFSTLPQAALYLKSNEGNQIFFKMAHFQQRD